MKQIPHTIHYIWLGKNKLPESYYTSLESAQKYAPGFVVKLWREEEALEFNLPPVYFNLLKNKKYAFASDVLRFYILEKYGGVYLDVDEVLVKDMTELVDSVQEEFFIARYHEVTDYYGFGLLGATAQNIFSKNMIEFYINLNSEASEYIIVNKIGSDVINSKKDVSVKIFDQEFFYPLTKSDHTKNTYAYHLANTSWVPAHKKMLYKLPFYNDLKNAAAKILPAQIKKKLGFNVKYS